MDDTVFSLHNVGDIYVYSCDGYYLTTQNIKVIDDNTHTFRARKKPS